MGLRLPPEYQEVEYLEGDGSAYINTGILPAVDLPFYCRFLVTSASAPGYGNVFGSRENGNSKEYQLTAFQGGCVSVGTRNNVRGIILDKINEVSFDGDHTAIVNGVVHTITTSESQHNQPIILFGIYNNKLIAQTQQGRIYVLTFGNVANFVPCYRKSDDEPGMYDLVSRTFFTNAGSGEFTVGPDVIDSISPWMVARRRILMKPPKLPAAYQEVKYIASDGLSCIQTDVYPSNTMGFDCKYYTENPFIWQTVGYGCIFGGRFASGNNDLQLTTFTNNSALKGSLRFGGSSAYNAGITRFAVETSRLRNLKYYLPDETSIDISTYNWTNDKRAIALFLLNNNGSYTQGGSGCRIYIMRFYDGDTLIRDYVPCYRKSDGVIGMYELVTGTFLTNAGSGSFTKGSDVFY